MFESKRFGGRLYRLVIKNDGAAPDEIIEFEANGPESALFMAQRYRVRKEAELYEGERSLGRVKLDPRAGFWVIAPPAEKQVIMANESAHPANIN